MTDPKQTNRKWVSKKWNKKTNKYIKTYTFKGFLTEYDVFKRLHVMFVSEYDPETYPQKYDKAYQTIMRKLERTSESLKNPVSSDKKSFLVRMSNSAQYQIHTDMVGKLIEMEVQLRDYDFVTKKGEHLVGWRIVADVLSCV